MPHRKLKLTELALAVLLLFCGAASAVAANGMQITLPLGTTKNWSGLVLQIDGRGVDANGYRPIKITVTANPPKPLPADRQIRIVMKPNAYSGVPAANVSQVIDLPEGSISTTATLTMPQTTMWHGMSIETYEGGRMWEDLSQRYMAWSRINQWDWSEARPAMLFLDSDVPPDPGRTAAIGAYRTTGADPTPTHDLPDVRTLVWLFPDPNTVAGAPTATGMPRIAPAANAPKATDVMLLAQIHDLVRIEMLAPSALPERWIDMSQYDVATISLADLQDMAVKQPKQLAALRDWVSTGPQLIVYGAGEKFGQLPAIEKLLAVPALANRDGGPSGPSNWTLPDRKYKRAELLTPFSSDYQTPARRIKALRSRRNLAAIRSYADPVIETPLDNEAAAAGSLPPFVFRRAGTGCIAAIAAEEPFPGKDTDWIWLFNAVPDQHWKWFRREGFSLTRTNDDYWDFLIPGVGDAPVWSFLILVSLFAVAIGPINYLLLGRSRRLYLLLLTVPAGALVVTFSLIGYALLTDGLGVRLRSRSFVDLDQRTGRAAAWARQSYYASISPSQGLQFPSDTTIFPVVAQPAPRGSQRSSGLLVWDEGQNLRSGFLASRTATQFMLQRATTSEAKLVVREGTTPGQPPAVENKLGANVRYLLLRDRRGDYFAISALEREQTATPRLIQPEAAQKELEKIWEAAAPTPPDPERLATNRNNALSFLFWRSYANYGNQDSGAGDPLMDAGILETSLDEASQPAKHPLSPGSYTAIVDSSVCIPSGVPRVREEASLHVIRGRY